MEKNSVYNIKTDILKSDKTKLQVNIFASNLTSAINGASYLKYNGEEIGNHIISAEKIVDNVYEYTYNIEDLNPNYKPKEDANKQEK